MFQLVLLCLSGILFIVGVISYMRKDRPGNKTPPSVAIATIICSIGLAIFAYIIMPLMFSRR